MFSHRPPLPSLFGTYGDVTCVKIPYGKGCGFIEFAEHADAETAIAQLHGHLLGNHNVRLSWGRQTLPAYMVPQMMVPAMMVENDGEPESESADDHQSQQQQYPQPQQPQHQHLAQQQQSGDEAANGMPHSAVAPKPATPKAGISYAQMVARGAK